MVPYCGGVYRVLRRVTRILNEKTGKLLHFKNDCIVLEGVVCQSLYTECKSLSTVLSSEHFLLLA